MIKSDDLADELRSLWHQAILNLLVYCFESEPEGLVHVAYAVELRVMRPHNRAIITEELLAGVAEVAERLRVEHA